VTELGATSYVTFEVKDDDGRWRGYDVDLATGMFRGWIDETGSREPTAEARVAPITPVQALDKAERLVARYLGPKIASGMSFTVTRWPTHEAGDEVCITAEGRRPGDPPRYGLSPVCHLSLSRSTGLVMAYSQQVPDPEEPIPPQVTPERAIELALAEADKRHYRASDVHTRGAAELRQHKGGLWWTIQFDYDTPAGDGLEHLAYIAEVDALTGTVTTLDPAVGIAPEQAGGAAHDMAGVPAHARAESRDGDKRTLRAAIGAGTVLLVAALGLAAVLVHRRARKGDRVA
jgi:hypothetical protein